MVNLGNSLPPTAVEAKLLGNFKVEVDWFLFSTGVKGYTEKAGLRGKNRSDTIEWQSRLDGRNGLILLLCLLTLWF